MDNHSNMDIHTLFTFYGYSNYLMFNWMFSRDEIFNWGILLFWKQILCYYAIECDDL